MSKTSSIRLRRGIPILQRSNGQIQLGSTGPGCQIISGLTPDQQQQLLTAPRRVFDQRKDDPTVIAILRNLNLVEDPEEQQAAAFHLRSEHQALLRLEGDSQSLNIRQRAKIRLLDQTGLSHPLGLLLACSGITEFDFESKKTVTVNDCFPLLEQHLGWKRHRAFSAQLKTVNPRVKLRPTFTSSLTVISDYQAIDTADYRRLVGEAEVTLPIVFSEYGVEIGPLFNPLTPGPCLGCIHRHRSERDPDYPQLLRQLATSAACPPGPVDLWQTAVATTQIILAFLDGRQVPTGDGIMRFTWRRPEPSYSRFSVHPDCYCQR